ncbi:MAG: RDD family protein [Planctomycetia bacterium]|nr:RDD family protein [Planctomycetia bacterium]
MLLVMSRSDADPGAAFRVSTDLVIETPENVVLSYRLAGPAVRLLAYLVDLCLRIVILIGMWIAALIGGIVAGGVTMGMFLVAVFLVDWAYFGLSEAFFRGKTLGKHLFGLRVFQEQGYPATIWGALLRNFVRFVDNMSLWGVCFVTMVVSGRFRRLGDLVGQTVVIEERRVRVPREPIILEKIRPLSRTELGSYVPSGQTLALIEEFLGRRHVLTYRRGHAMAFVLARPLANRLAFSGDPHMVDRYPMAFLAAVYATFYQVHEGEDDEDSAARPGAGRVRREQPVGAGATS